VKPFITKYASSFIRLFFLIRFIPVQGGMKTNSMKNWYMGVANGHEPLAVTSLRKTFSCSEKSIG